MPTALKRRQAFLTKAEESKLIPYNEYESSPNIPDLMEAIVQVKYFNAYGSGTWLMVAYDAEHQIFYGYADLYGNGDCAEWGGIAREELENLAVFGGVPRIERDMYFTPRPAKDCIDSNGRITA